MYSHCECLHRVEKRQWLRWGTGGRRRHGGLLRSQCDRGSRGWRSRSNRRQSLRWAVSKVIYFYQSGSGFFFGNSADTLCWPHSPVLSISAEMSELTLSRRTAPSLSASCRMWSADQKWGILGKHFPTSAARWKPNLCSNKINVSVCSPDSCCLFQGTTGIDWFTTGMGEIWPCTTSSRVDDDTDSTYHPRYIQYVAQGKRKCRLHFILQWPHGLNLASREVMHNLKKWSRGRHGIKLSFHSKFSITFPFWLCQYSLICTVLHPSHTCISFRTALYFFLQWTKNVRKDVLQLK